MRLCVIILSTRYREGQRARRMVSEEQGAESPGVGREVRSTGAGGRACVQRGFGKLTRLCVIIINHLSRAEEPVAESLGAGLKVRSAGAEAAALWSAQRRRQNNGWKSSRNCVS